MKRIISIMLSLAMLLVLAACGQTGGSDTDTATGEVSEAAAGESSDSYVFSGTVTLLCDSDAGSNEDMLCRALAAACQEISGTTFVVENVPGGNSATAIQTLKTSRDDDRKMYMLMESNSMALSMLQGTNPYDIEDIDIVSKISSDWTMVVTTTQTDIETWEDIVAYAKANPGDLNWGGAGSMGATQLFVSSICHDADIEVNYVAYSGVANARVGLLAGDVLLMSATSANLVDALREEGSEYVAIITSKPEADWEGIEIATCLEKGLEGTNDYASSRAIYVDSEMSHERKLWLEGILERAVETDSFNEFAANNNIIQDYMDMEDARAWFEDYIEMAQEIIPLMK